MSYQGFLNTDFNDFMGLLHEDELVEEPVPVDVFLYDKYYMGFKHLSELQTKLVSVISQIFLPDTLLKLYGEEEAKRIWEQDTVSEIVAQVGKGGGKDFVTRTAFCYAIYKLHCLKDPLEYYGKANGTYIDFLNIAVNADQAKNVFFDPLKNVMKGSPWFNKVGFEPRMKEVHFYERPIRLFSGNSEAEAWEGLDLLLVALDEIAAFKTDTQLKGENKNRLSASAIYKMSKLSVMSRFPEVGKVCLLSFPRYAHDFIQQRYDESENEPKVFRLKARTYEMNPLITRKMLDPEYIRDPVGAHARFDCEPPEMVDAYFRDPMKVRQCFIGNWTLINAGTSNQRYKLEEIEEINPIDDFGRLKPWFNCTDEFTRFIHVDLALKHDRAAIAMVHIPGVREIEIENGRFEKLPVVKMDLIHWWEAQSGQEIDFANIREFIALLCRKFPVALVTFDQWGSQDMIQNLNRRGIRAEMHGVKVSDYDTLQTAFYDGRFSGYFRELLVEEELLKLQMLPNGKIDHPSSGGKDTADALAGATWNACSMADLELEIDIQILGDDDDWEEMEMLDAQMDDKEKQLGDRVRRSKVLIPDTHDMNDFELEMV